LSGRQTLYDLMRADVSGRHVSGAPKIRAKFRSSPYIEQRSRAIWGCVGVMFLATRTSTTASQSRTALLKDGKSASASRRRLGNDSVPEKNSSHGEQI